MTPPYKIPLMRNAFLHDRETRFALSKFITRTTRLSMGDQCAKFEGAFAKWQGRAHAVLFNSGASANLALLQSLQNIGRLKRGDAIGFSALTWGTNVMPILQLGMTPAPIDCEHTTLNSMSYQMVYGDLQAVFLTNALGFTGDLEQWRRLCASKGVLFLSDNCEALGAEVPEGKTGNFALAATFSFFVAHHLSTIEGGMVCTNDGNLAYILKMTRANGWDRSLPDHSKSILRAAHHVSPFEAAYTFYDLAFNMRPTEITGFLGLNQLQYLEENIERRGINHRTLDVRLRENDDLIPIDHSHMKRISPFAFPVLCKTPRLREKYLRKFTEAGVEVRPMIAGNIQRQPFYRKHVKQVEVLNGADFVHENGFYFGNYPDLTAHDLRLLGRLLDK